MNQRHTHTLLFALSLIAVFLSVISLRMNMNGAPNAVNVPVEANTMPADTAGMQSASGDAIRSYLLENPDVIYEALQRYQEKQQETEDQRAINYIKENQDEFYKDSKSPVLGNPQGDLTIIEFFDYNCGYCKRSYPTVKQVLAENKNIRLIHKNLPILGPTSLLAAKASLASQKQGKYEAFSNALLEFKGHLTDEDVEKIAKAVGLKGEQLQKDMEDPAIMQELESNMKLAQSVGITGTPAFILGERIIRGNISADQWKEEIAAAVEAKNALAAPVTQPESGVVSDEVPAPAVGKEGTAPATPSVDDNSAKIE